MKKGQDRTTILIMGGLGALIAAWIGIIAAPGAREGLRGLISALSYGIKHPFSLKFVPDTFTSCSSALASMPYLPWWW